MIIIGFMWLLGLWVCMVHRVCRALGFGFNTADDINSALRIIPIV